MSDRYIAGMRRRNRAATRITDKNIQSYLLLGAIWQLFPHARFILCDRDPKAVCWSCFQQPLSPMAFPWSTDLRSCALFNGAYRRLIDPLERTLPRIASSPGVRDTRQRPGSPDTCVTALHWTSMGAPLPGVPRTRPGCGFAQLPTSRTQALSRLNPVVRQLRGVARPAV